MERDHTEQREQEGRQRGEGASQRYGHWEGASGEFIEEDGRYEAREERRFQASVPFQYSYPPTTDGLPVFDYGVSTSAIRTTENVQWESNQNRIVRRDPSTGEYSYEPVPVPIIAQNHRYNPIRRSPNLNLSPRPRDVRQLEDTRWGMNRNSLPSVLSPSNYSLSRSPPSYSSNSSSSTLPSPLDSVSPISRSSTGPSGSRLERERMGGTGPETIGQLLMGVSNSNVSSEPRNDSNSSGERSRASSTSASVSSDLAVPSIKPFAQKLSFMLRNPTLYGDLIFWDPSGTHFLLLHGSDRLCKVVLPSIFSHSSMQAFQRQLNIYEFKHLPPATLVRTLAQFTAGSGAPLAFPEASYSGYYHPHFLKADIDALPPFTASSASMPEFGKSLLSLLKPRPSRARALKKRERERVER